MVQDIDGRSHVVTVLVEILDGPGCEVLIDDADDIGSLAGKIGRAIAMVLDAQRRALHQCSLWADQHPLALPDPSTQRSGRSTAGRCSTSGDFPPDGCRS